MENETQETIETPIEETQETIDTTEEESGDIPTVEDYEKLKKEAETLRAQKEHWKKKATTVVEPLKKETNETQTGLTREEAILYAKGYTDEEVTLATKLAKINDTTPLKAIEDDFFKARVDARLKQEKSEKASLSPSSGAGRYKNEKPMGEMSKEEHEAYYKKVMGV